MIGARLGRQQYGIFRHNASAPGPIACINPVRLPRGARSYLNTADWEPVRTKQKPPSKLLISLLIFMPITSFCLGIWQIKRLDWKNRLIARAETQLSRQPLELPPNINPDVVKDFDYRRVTITGTWDHQHEMLVGPRIHDGRDGYYVITPLRRVNGSTLLVNRGWVSKEKAAKSERPASLIEGPVTIRALLRDKPMSNSFTSVGRPDIGIYHFLDIDEMAQRTGSQPIHIQQLLDESGGLLMEQQLAKGIPVGFPPKVEFRNTHFQYVVTWFGLSAITAVMLISVLRQKRATGIQDAMRDKVKHASKWQ